MSHNSEEQSHGSTDKQSHRCPAVKTSILNRMAFVVGALCPLLKMCSDILYIVKDSSGNLPLSSNKSE